LLIQGVQTDDEDPNAAHGQAVEDAPCVGGQRS
jgi:hypothetical protein